MEPNNQPIQATAVSMNGQKKVGPIIATLIIVLILIIAALYLFASKINQPAIPTDNTVGEDDSSMSAQAVVPVTSTSTDTDSLMNDLNNSTGSLDNQNF